MIHSLGTALIFLRQRNAQVWITLINTFLVCVILGFGLALNASPHSFQSPYFVRFLEIAKQDYWAYACFTVAVIGFLGIIARSRLWNLLPLFIVATFHGTLAVLFWKSLAYGEHMTTGVATYGCVAILGYILFALRATE